MTMEVNHLTLNSTITEKWKVYTIGGLFCLFVVALFVTSDFKTVDEIDLARTTIAVVSSTTTNINTTDAAAAAVIVTRSSLPSDDDADQAVDQTVDSFTTTTSTSDGLNDDDHHQKVDYRSSTPPTTVVKEEITSISNDATSHVTTTALPPVKAIANEASMSSMPVAASVLGSSDTESTTHAVQDAKEDKKSSSSSSSSISSCNIYDGRWVYKPTENPMYYVENCPFLEDQPSCRRNGRPDSDYEGWGWEPNDCDIPLFNGRDMLERLRGKRVIYAGDSLGRNQWLSMACLIYTSVSPSQSFVKLSGSYKLLTVKDYNFTLEFFWSPLLVNVGSNRKILRLDVLDPSSEQWKGADVMVFNTGHWWTHGPTVRSWKVIKYKGRLINEMEKELVYERVLSTLSTWLTQNVDPHKTTVFFRGISPEHKGKDWCFNATSPIPDDSYTNIYPQSMINVTETMFATEQQNKSIIPAATDHFPVRYLNITRLSGYRKDAHPSLYSRKESLLKELLVEQPDMETLARRHSDCSHWCLPGVPDTWNRLLYVSLFFSADSR